MKCRPIVNKAKANDIQTVERCIRMISEARISQLERKVLEALHSGLKITDLKITEIITWTDREIEFDYQVKVERKQNDLRNT